MLYEHTESVYPFSKSLSEDFRRQDLLSFKKMTKIQIQKNV